MFPSGGLCSRSRWCGAPWHNPLRDHRVRQPSAAMLGSPRPWCASAPAARPRQVRPSRTLRKPWPAPDRILHPHPARPPQRQPRAAHRRHARPRRRRPGAPLRPGCGRRRPAWHTNPPRPGRPARGANQGQTRPGRSAPPALSQWSSHRPLAIRLRGSRRRSTAGGPVEGTDGPENVRAVRALPPRGASSFCSRHSASSVSSSNVAASPMTSRLRNSLGTDVSKPGSANSSLSRYFQSIRPRTASAAR